MDIELIEKVVAELSERISGSRVSKIHQPAAALLVFRLRAGQENLKLLISADSADARIHLTEQSFANPFTPPRFCQLLRARLSRINTISQLNNDRIVAFDCQGAKGDCRLIVELTGKNCNFILADEDGRIIDVLNRVDPRLLPGKMYSYPPLQAEARSSEERSADIEQLGASQVVEKLYTQNEVTESATQLQVRLKKIVDKALRKISRRKKNIEQERQRQEDFELYRQRGDLILANLYQLKKGLSAVTLQDVFQDPPTELTLALNPQLSPQENADRYYQKYRKYRRGLEHSERRLRETGQELAWLEQLSYQLAVSREPLDLSLVADELRQAGLLREKSTRLPRVDSGRSLNFRESRSPGGFRVLCGRNSRQNDALSTRMLKKMDLWFHAHRSPGAHVVLKADSALGPFKEEDIDFAASIAAANSRAGQAAKVEVMYAVPKDVKKPQGTRPGMVTVQQYKTIVVRPFTEGAEDFQ